MARRELLYFLPTFPIESLTTSWHAAVKTIKAPASIAYMHHTTERTGLKRLAPRPQGYFTTLCAHVSQRKALYFNTIIRVGYLELEKAHSGFQILRA